MVVLPSGALALATALAAVAIVAGGARATRSMHNMTFSGSPPGLSEATDCAVREAAWR